MLRVIADVVFERSQHGDDESQVNDVTTKRKDGVGRTDVLEHWNQVRRPGVL